MTPTFISGIGQYFPNARITYNKFQVMDGAGVLRNCSAAFIERFKHKIQKFYTGFEIPKEINKPLTPLQRILKLVTLPSINSICW